MATRHTGGEAQEDSDTDLSEQDDRTEKYLGKRGTKLKILHSRALQRVTGRKLGADVTPVKVPAHVQAPTARRTSDTLQQPPKHMATRHTGGEAQEDSDKDLSEQDDRTEKYLGKRGTKQKILHSKVMQRVTGRKRVADVTPAKKVQPPPAHVQAPTARRTSDTLQQPPKHSQEQNDQQMLFQYRNSPPPEEQHYRSHPHTQSTATTQQRRPDTSPQQTHAPAGTVLREQPQRLPSHSDPPNPPLQSIAYDHLQQVT